MSDFRKKCENDPKPHLDCRNLIKIARTWMSNLPRIAWKWRFLYSHCKAQSYSRCRLDIVYTYRAKIALSYNIFLFGKKRKYLDNKKQYPKCRKIKMWDSNLIGALNFHPLVSTILISLKLYLLLTTIPAHPYFFTGITKMTSLWRHLQLIHNNLEWFL